LQLADVFVPRGKLPVPRVHTLEAPVTRTRRASSRGRIFPSDRVQLRVAREPIVAVARSANRVNKAAHWGCRAGSVLVREKHANGVGARVIIITGGCSLVSLPNRAAAFCRRLLGSEPGARGTRRIHAGRITAGPLMGFFDVPFRTSTTGWEFERS